MDQKQISKKKIQQTLIAVVSIVILIIVDQITKWLVVQHLKGSDPIPLISGVFQLNYLENQGAAFGILQGKQGFFTVITIIILIAVFYILVCMPAEKRFRKMRVILILILSGAIGNFIDRTRQEYVVDFFDFVLIHFPIFNVADIYVTAAAIALIVFILFYYKEDDLKKMADACRQPFKKKEA